MLVAHSNCVDQNADISLNITCCDMPGISLISLIFYFIEFVTSPENVTVCDAQSLPQVFNISCTFRNSQVLPSWIVTGLDGVADQSIVLQGSVDSLSYAVGSSSMNSVPGVATLTVDRSAGMEVTVGTCFMCQFATNPPTSSDQACVEEIGEL